FIGKKSLSRVLFPDHRKVGSAFTFGGVHFRPRLRAVRRMDSSRLQVASERFSFTRLRRYSFSVSVVSRETLMCPKNGRMFASTHQFQILAVDALMFALACSRRSSSSSPQVVLSAAALTISPRDFLPRIWSRSRLAS